MELKKGDRIRLKLHHEKHWKHGTVVIASENGRSIAVAFTGEPIYAAGFVGDVFPLFVDPERRVFEGFTGDIFDVQLARTAKL